MAVEAPPSEEARMLGELKALINQLDPQTKAATMGSLYQMLSHAQVPSSVPMVLHAPSQSICAAQTTGMLHSVATDCGLAAIYVAARPSRRSVVFRLRMRRGTCSCVV